jgi:hypothetical protein
MEEKKYLTSFSKNIYFWIWILYRLCHAYKISDYIKIFLNSIEMS